jgi:hypothetical protein
VLSSFVHVTVLPLGTEISVGTKNSVALGLEDPAAIDTASCAYANVAFCVLAVALAIIFSYGIGFDQLATGLSLPFGATAVPGGWS